MTVLFIIGLLSCAIWLTSLFVYIEQRLLKNDKMCADALLWQMYSFTVFAITIMVTFI